MARIVRETLPVVDAIEARIKAEGLSIRAASTKLGVSPQTVSYWLRGAVAPQLNSDTQQTIGRFLGVSPRKVVELFGIDLGSDALRGHIIQDVAAVYTPSRQAA